MRGCWFKYIFVLLMVIPASIVAQNPFDLQHRLGKDTIVQDPRPEIDTVVEVLGLRDVLGPEDGADTYVEMDTAALDGEKDTVRSSTKPTVNPFDRVADAVGEPMDEKSKEEGPLEEPKEEVERTVKSDRVFTPYSSPKKNNLLLIIFLTLTVFLALIVAADRSIMNKLYRSLINDNFLNYFLREQKGGTSLQLFFLYIFFVVNLGLFAYFFFNGIFNLESEIKLWQCIGGVGLIYLTRYFFTQYQLLFIKARKELRQFYFTVVIFNIFIGLVIFPLNAFAAFATSVTGGVAMYIGLFVVVAIYLLRQFRGLFIGSKFLINNQFHFFIYLCTVEIAPMVILGKFFISIFF